TRALALVVFALLLWGQGRGFPVIAWEQCPLTDIVADQGYGYRSVVRTPHLLAVALAQYTLLENGRALDASFSQPAAIRNSGKGRFYIGPNVVLFSTSDNSDPRTNQRSYEIRYAQPI